MNLKAPPPELGPGKRVLAYLRDSGGEKQELSTAHQRAELQGWCEKHGIIVVEVFEDIARSGTSTAGREQFDRMIDQCHKPKLAEGVIIWNFARFARNLNDSAYFKADLRRRGLVVHSLTDDIPEGPYAQVVETIIDITNEEKSRQTSRDSKRGLAQHVEAGYSSGGGTPPRGYRAVREIISSHRDGSPRVGAKWEIDPETAPLVIMAFKMRAASKSLNEIMQAPCGRLYKTKACWATFFANRSYLGLGKCGGLEFPNHHPAIIDPELWEAVRAVQERIHNNQPGSLLHPKRYHSPSLLSGLAVCIHCGTPIIREVSGPTKWKAYVCGKKRSTGNWHACEGKQITASKADDAIVDAVLTKILTSEYAGRLLGEIRMQLADSSELDRQEQAVRLALTNGDKAISRLIDAIEESGSPSAKGRLKERENERALLQFELSSMEGRRQAAQLQISPETLSLVLAVWRGQIENARDHNDIRALQSLLRSFVTKIELGKRVARLWYTYPINAFATVSTNAPSGPPSTIERWTMKQLTPGKLFFVESRGTESYRPVTF